MHWRRKPITTPAFFMLMASFSMASPVFSAAREPLEAGAQHANPLHRGNITADARRPLNPRDLYKYDVYGLETAAADF